MKRSEISSSSQAYSKTTKSYVIALSLIASLSSLAYFMMQQIIGTQHHQAAIINKSGRQRMLSQRIALLSENLMHKKSNSTDPISTYLHDELKRVTDEFEKSHQSLSQEDSFLGNPISEVKNIYFSKEYHLDDDVKELISNSRIINLPSSEITKDKIIALEKVRALTLNTLIPKLDLVVQLNQSESERQVVKLEDIDKLILGFTWLLLIIEAFFIFRPMAISIAKLLRAALEAEASAVEATHAKSAFLATITHEIRTPMTGVLGITEFLLNSKLSPQQEEQLNTVHRLSSSLMIMVNDILDYSKIEASKLVLENISFKPFTVAQDTRTLFASSADAKNITLKVEFDKNLPEELNGDPTRIRQIVTNFVGNSFKFTPKDGTITVFFKCLNSSDPKSKITLRVEVKDTGAGIPLSAQGKLFTRYTQADSSTTRKFGGTGLGLSICKQLIDLMGGRIGLSSEEGKGATFWFEVELAIAEPMSLNVQTAVTPRSEVKLRFNDASILLAEDNPTNGTVISAQLKKLGARVKIATNGKEAVEMSRSGEDFDLILMDCEMPIMDGFEATKEIRLHEQQNKLRAISIVAMTAHTAQEIRQQCIDCGMTSFIDKPIKLITLANILNSLLGNKEPSIEPKSG